MPEDRQVLRAAADLADHGRPFVLITVVRAQGSTPRDPGAKMLWRPAESEEPRAKSEDPLTESIRSDLRSSLSAPRSDTLLGTVGGGQFEMLVLDAARTHFERRSRGLERYVLAADADQCCGGVMEVFFEYHGPRQRLVIFGAGHVAHALAELMSAAPLDMAIVDDRPDWNSPDRFPRARRILSFDAGVGLALAEPASTLACVMTCSHDTDLELLRKLLRAPPAFLGLIGSRSKRACLFGRLVASGADDQAVQRIHCPIGVGDTGKEPRLVAISMAAQLLLEAKRLAPRPSNA